MRRKRKLGMKMSRAKKPREQEAAAQEGLRGRGQAAEAQTVASHLLTQAGEWRRKWQLPRAQAPPSTHKPMSSNTKDERLIYKQILYLSPVD